MPSCLLLSRIFFVIASVCSVSLVLRADEPIEGAPILMARDLLSDELLKGEHHRVRGLVMVEDFEYRFVIDSDFGRYPATGVAELNRRVREIEAIATLNEVSQTEAFASSLGKTITDPVVMTVGVARKPISTVTGIPMGLGRYLQGKFYQVQRRSSQAISTFRGSGEEENDEPEKEGEKKPMVQRVGSSANSLSKKHLGYNDAKRSWSHRLGVDPYSDNDALQEALNRIAWSSSLGGFAGDYVAPGSEVFSYAGRANELVWEQSPTQVERFNQKTLRGLGVQKATIESFTEHPGFSLTEKALVTLALDSIGKVDNLETLLEMALETLGREDAKIFINTLQILASYCENVSPIQRIEIKAGMITANAANGYMIVPLALDYLHWNTLISSALSAGELDCENRELWLSGEVSTIAAQQLRDNEWHVFQRCLENLPSRAPRYDVRDAYRSRNN